MNLFDFGGLLVGGGGSLLFEESSRLKLDSAIASKRSIELDRCYKPDYSTSSTVQSLNVEWAKADDRAKGDLMCDDDDC